MRRLETAFASPAIKGGKLAGGAATQTKSCVQGFWQRMRLVCIGDSLVFQGPSFIVRGKEAISVSVLNVEHWNFIALNELYFNQNNIRQTAIESKKDGRCEE